MTSFEVTLASSHIDWLERNGCAHEKKKMASRLAMLTTTFCLILVRDVRVESRDK